MLKIRYSRVIKLLKHKGIFVSPLRGFTLVEIMVAMVVLAVGLLGMAAMMVFVMKGNRGAASMTSATSICQQKLEELKDLDWEVVGNWDNTMNFSVEAIGAQNADMAQEADLNPQGKTQEQVCTDLLATDCSGVTCSTPSAWTNPTCIAAVKALGPYKITRTFVVCKGLDYTWNAGTNTNDVPAGFDSNDISTDPERFCKVDKNVVTTRTKWLDCEPEDITTEGGPTNKEKKLKTLCAWRASDGSCHQVHLDTTIVSL